MRTRSPRSVQVTAVSHPAHTRQVGVPVCAHMQGILRFAPYPSWKMLHPKVQDVFWCHGLSVDDRA